jgi:hypothetical protein
VKASRIVVACLLLVVAPTALLAAPGGAGGIGFGVQSFDTRLASHDLGLMYITGFGYGVDGGGTRFGGFGMALLGPVSGTWGGVGGILTGYELRAGPIEIALNLLGGPGGLAFGRGGYFILFGQADLEVGLTLLPWMQVVVYGGFQAWGNLIPGFPLREATLTTPVYGIRVAWGGF